MKNNRIHAAVTNHMGRARRNNEDNFCLNGRYMPLTAMDAGGTFSCAGEGLQVYAVCDGMGGGEAGEDAAFTVAEGLSMALSQGRLRSVEDLRRTLQKLSDAIYRKHDRLSGSTLALLLVAGDKALVTNIGDSRVYSLYNGVLTQVSHDHSGYQAHTITQFLGMPEEERLEPFEQVEPVGEWLKNADSLTYLLCSDGLTDLVSDGDIQSILASTPDPKAATQLLVDAALQHGGKDNVTAMVVRIPDQATKHSPIRKSPLWLTALQALSGIGMAYAAIELILRLAARA